MHNGATNAESSRPTLPSSIRGQMLDILVRILSPVGAHRNAIKQAKNAMRSSKRRKVEADGESVVAEQLITPTIASNLHTGINAVTKVLETQAGASKSHSDRKRKRKRGDSSVLIPTQPEESIGNGGAMAASPELRQPISLVFVCRPDINPHALVAHLPLLVSAVNSRASVDSSGVVLVPLDVGAEARLGAALGLPRVAVVAITADAPECATLEQLVRRHLTPLRATWLSDRPLDQVPGISPTHVKQLAVVEPLNPRARRQQRKEGKRRKIVAV